ncbi:hypothetical protein IQ227_08590 [Anabaena aphanizomenioides LEGE 00250]|uniref:Uncharacterized protein n=1 Tax=Sphaerospermopsis aphanizomenoides LEGE 00250 TaxID=2777972 RepID=A0ABR9VC65_9CYAN|nr:hypothetical protein [Sphaerospermopsis aphanizomenoides]MBE9236086.1 hypothetical protein [Sphaerospermopsis aphanizomenoides LEGE 00250]
MIFHFDFSGNGDRTIPRLKYRNGEVIIMSPLPKHGQDAHVITSIIRAC